MGSVFQKTGSVMLLFVGAGDVTEWLQRVNVGDPIVYPLWPADFPQHVALGIRWRTAVPADAAAQPPYDLILPFSRNAMLQERQPYRLWFCQLPRDDVVEQTTAESRWFCA